jgi:hypothetical protein
VTFFADRNLGRLLPIALSLLGIDIEIHDAHFTETTPDDVWLPDVARRGWVVLTEDPRIKSRANELQAITDHSAACFVLTTAGLTRWEKARVLAKVWDEIERIVREESPPYVYRITKTGRIDRLYPQSD